MIEPIYHLKETIEKEKKLRDLVSIRQGPWVQYQSEKWPLMGFTMGSKIPEAPTLFLVGGVHGLERIGADLCWSFLKTTTERLLWDENLVQLFQKIRCVFIPLLNPYGYYQLHRSNARGVDLMRNSPVDAVDSTPKFLGGHRISPRLPWYRGTPGKLEVENQFLKDLFFEFTAQSQAIISLDFHSGFGMKDRIWFPYSYRREPFEKLAELTALFHLFENTYPHHIYKIEPQSHGYLLNGDMWDYFFLEHLAIKNDKIFIPLTLEMGSWNWVKKNPLQLFSRDGAFNPMKAHRQKRTLRRHHLLYDFLLRALYSHQPWTHLDSTEKHKFLEQGLNKWYHL